MLCNLTDSPPYYSLFGEVGYMQGWAAPGFALPELRRGHKPYSQIAEAPAQKLTPLARIAFEHRLGLAGLDSKGERHNSPILMTRPESIARRLVRMFRQRISLPAQAVLLVALVLAAASVLHIQQTLGRKAIGNA